MEADISGSIPIIVETKTGMAMNLLTEGGLCPEPIILDNLQVLNLEFSPFLKEQMLGKRIITVKGNIIIMKSTDRGACLVIGQGQHLQDLIG